MLPVLENVPLQSTFNPALTSTLVSFGTPQSVLVGMAGLTMTLKLDQLDKTCKDIPTRPLINAIAEAKCPTVALLGSTD